MAPAPLPDTAPSVPSTSPSSPDPMVRGLVGFAAVVVALVGLHLGREFLGPLLLAAVIVIICHPVRHPFDRRGWPRWAGTIVVVVLAYVIVAAMALLLSWAGLEFVNLVVEYTDELQASAQSILAWGESLAPDTQVADAAANILDPASIAGWATSLGGAVLGLLTGFFLVLVYVIFMAVDGGRYTGAERTYGLERAATVSRFRGYNAAVRRYFTVNAAFGAITAVIDGLALWWLGVPAPAVWAVLSFVTNFIPNIGFVLGVVPPAVLALMIGGWPLMLGVLVIYSVANVVLQVFIQPKFISDAVSLSLTLAFFSVLFWTFVLGPLGAILAIPMTLLVRALILEGDPSTTWLRWLTGDRAVAPVAVAAAAAERDLAERETAERIAAAQEATDAPTSVTDARTPVATADDSPGSTPGENAAEVAAAPRSDR